MNVLDAIKGTILSVPKDITSGIKSLTTPTRSTAGNHGDSDSSGTEEAYYMDQQGINYDAGTELLNRFQNEWSELHQKSEVNAKKAKAADVQISDLYLYLERQNDAVNQFLLEISSLPQLLTDLQGATSKISALESQFEELEADLLVLEDVCEEQEQRRNKQHHEYQLATYSRRRAAELEAAKVRLAKQHAVRVQKYEHHLQKTLTERQKAFEASFRADVQHYKTHGHVSPPIERDSPSAEFPAAVIDDFVPEGDATALDEFLAMDQAPDEQAVVPSAESEGEPALTPADDEITEHSPSTDLKPGDNVPGADPQTDSRSQDSEDSSAAGALLDRSSSGGDTNEQNTDTNPSNA